MKKLIVALFCLTTIAGYGQCTFGPAQWINAYYEYKALRTRYILQAPRSLVAPSCRDTAMVYYNPADSALHYWTGHNDLTNLATNGLTTIAADTVKLGGVINRFTLLDDSANRKHIFIKTLAPPGGVYNLGPWPNLMLGEDTVTPTAKNTNYVNDSHANLNAPLQILRKTPWPLFTRTPLAYMGATDATDLNGFLFRLFSNAPGSYEPVIETYANKDSTQGQQHGLQIFSYMKEPPVSTAVVSTMFTFVMSDLDSLSVLNHFGSILRNCNILAFETGNLHPLIQDRYLHMRIGDVNFISNPGTVSPIIAKGQLEIVPDTAVYRILQSGPLGLNVMEAPLQIGGTSPETLTASAIFELISTSKGFLNARMTTTQKLAIVSPAEGLQVYDLTLHQMSYFNGTTWVNF